MNNDRYDIVNELIARSLTGEASAEDEKKLSSWIAESQQNERHFLALKNAFELSGTYYAHQTLQDLDINIDQEWDHFTNRARKKEESTAARDVKPMGISMPGSRTIRPWLRVAAALVLMVAAGIMINYFVSGTTQYFRTTDKTMALSLPDGSQVLLNRNSEFSYSSHFGSKTRTVNLKGEAFFEVVRNPDRPFVIKVHDAEVEVLGTTFDVQAYDDSKAVEVTVETGIVKLSAPDLKKEVSLHAGDKGIFSKASREISSLKNDNINFLSWNTQKIVFIENDLQTVVETLNRAYGSNIILDRDIPSSCVVTVTFDRQTLEAVLNVLKTTLNLNYQKQGNQIEITHACMP